MTNKSDDSSQLEDFTTVDLGEDLFEKTAQISATTESSEVNPSPKDPLPSSHPDRTSALQESVQSAQILLNENLISDAKKVLHQVLMVDPNYRPAMDLMVTLQQRELKQIFSGAPLQRRLSAREEQTRATPSPTHADDPDLLLRKLDEDFDLGLLVAPTVSSSGARWSENLASAQTLDEAREAPHLERQLFSSDPQDWMDVGIAFFEMELFTLACHFFDQSHKKAGSAMNGPARLASACLTAETLLRLGRPFEVLSRLQPLLRESEFPMEARIEVYYWLARAHQSIGQERLATQFYQEVKRLDPFYRNLDLTLGKPI
ncbi:MAG: hypothetical protein ACO3A2_03035 [Bdellovibrionia bacterium]